MALTRIAGGPLSPQAVALLEKTDGVLRYQGTAQTAAANDHQILVLYFEELKRKSRATQRAYTREIARFVRWATEVRGKSISDLLREDYLIYDNFLQAPPADWVDDGERGTKGADEPTRSARTGSPQHRPFRGPLSVEARNYALGVISNLLGWMVARGYLLANPIPDPVSIAGRPVLRSREDKSIPDEIWRVLREVIGRRIHDPDGKVRRAALRERAVVSLAFGLGMRRADFQTSTAGSIQRRRINGQPAWVWIAVRKGLKQTEIPVLDWVMDAWGDYRVEIGLARHPTHGEQGPLIPSRTNPARPITGERVYECIKRVCEEAHRVLASRGEADPDAAYLALAVLDITPHWLRHSAISLLLRSGEPVTVVRDFAGHSNIATTDHYAHAKTDEIARGVSKLLPPV